MDYKKIYDDLVNDRAIHQHITDKSDPNYKYGEWHHIVPRCMGGSNKRSNLVFLFYREHIIAHKLLHKIYPTNWGLTLACEAMYMVSSINKHRGDPLKFISSRKLAQLKEEAAYARTQILKQQRDSMTAEEREIAHQERSKQSKAGWKKMSKETKRQRSLKIGRAFKIRHASRTDEELRIWKQRISDAQKQFSDEKRRMIQEKRLKTWREHEQLKTPEDKIRRSERCKLVQNSLPPDVKERKAKKCAAASRKFWDNASDEQIRLHNERTSKARTKWFARMSNEDRDQFAQTLSKAKTGSKSMFKDGQYKRVMKYDIQQHLDDGWIFKAPSQPKYQDTHYWNNGIEHRRIKPSEEDTYRKMGWVKGRLRKKK